MFKMERLQKLDGCKRLGYILNLGFTIKELAMIANVTQEEIHALFKRTTVPDLGKQTEHCEWLLYDKLYVIYMITTSLLKLANYEKNTNMRVKSFLQETNMFRNVREEPPWYPLPELPGRVYPVWKPKNLREYLLEGRMVAAVSALQWLKN